MELTDSEVSYLKAIYEISKTGEIKVTKIADFLNFSKPSVIRALKNLNSINLINYTKDNIKLTEKGITYAKNIIRRDNVLKRFFIEILEIDEKTAAQDALKIKNQISCYTVRKLEEYICEKENVEFIDDKDFCICEFEKCSTCKH